MQTNIKGALSEIDVKVKTISVVHCNGKYVSSDTYDLDVYDEYTLSRAVMHLADRINSWAELDQLELAETDVAFKNRIKKHLGRGGEM